MKARNVVMTMAAAVTMALMLAPKAEAGPGRGVQDVKAWPGATGGGAVLFNVRDDVVREGPSTHGAAMLEACYGAKRFCQLDGRRKVVVASTRGGALYAGTRGPQMHTIKMRAIRGGEKLGRVYGADGKTLLFEFRGNQVYAANGVALLTTDIDLGNADMGTLHLIALILEQYDFYLDG